MRELTELEELEKLETNLLPDRESTPYRTRAMRAVKTRREHGYTPWDPFRGMHNPAGHNGTRKPVTLPTISIKDVT